MWISPLLAYRVSGRLTSRQSKEPAAPDLEHPSRQVLGPDLDVRVRDRLPVDADAPLLDQPPGVPVGLCEPRRRQQPREPHPSVVHGLRGDRRLRHLLRELVLAVHPVEALLSARGRVRAVVPAHDLRGQVALGLGRMERAVGQAALDPIELLRTPSVPWSSGTVNATWGSWPWARWMSRPTRRLKVWSVPPSSTSASIATESYPCISGYRNSDRLIGRPSRYRSEKSSRSRSRATVSTDASRATSSNLRAASHSLFQRTSARPRSSTRSACSR